LDYLDFLRNDIPSHLLIVPLSADIDLVLPYSPYPSCRWSAPSSNPKCCDGGGHDAFNSYHLESLCLKLFICRKKLELFLSTRSNVCSRLNLFTPLLTSVWKNLFCDWIFTRACTCMVTYNRNSRLHSTSYWWELIAFVTSNHHSPHLFRNIGMKCNAVMLMWHFHIYTSMCMSSYFVRSDFVKMGNFILATSDCLNHILFIILKPSYLMFKDLILLLFSGPKDHTASSIRR
jgi:hypothetical protein